MKKYMLAITVCLLLLSPSIFALNRDYKSINYSYSDGKDDFEVYSYSYSYSYCLNHIPCKYPNWIPSKLINFLPKIKSDCDECRKPSIYLGYLDPCYEKYRSHLIQQLEYCQENPKCKCYWPEYSSKSEKINESAYLLFRDLIKTTALSNLLQDEKELRAFNQAISNFTEHGLTISFIAQQFKFSDYYHVCKDIESYALAKYNEREVAKIKDKLDDVLEALYHKFFCLCIDCYAKHPNHNIKKEIQLMKLLVNDLSGLDMTLSCRSLCMHSYYDNGFYDVSDFIINNLETVDIPIELENEEIEVQKANFEPSFRILESSPTFSFENLQKAIRSFSVQSEILLEQGTLLNNLLLHKNAIEV